MRDIDINKHIDKPYYPHMYDAYILGIYRAINLCCKYGAIKSKDVDKIIKQLT